MSPFDLTLAKKKQSSVEVVDGYNFRKPLHLFPMSLHVPMSKLNEALPDKFFF
jgi:hypothetical protein